MIDPWTECQQAVLDALDPHSVGSVQSFASYMSIPEEAHALREAGIDLVFVGLDEDPEAALSTVESICSQSNITVMLYSTSTDPEMLLRGMRAGAREFFPFPPEPKLLAEAFERATTRITALDREDGSDSNRHAEVATLRSVGRLFVFCGAKGGAGVTTIASNFAVSLALLSGKRIGLLDLDLPLGDAALNLGLTSRYSALDALNNPHRLDRAYLSALMIEHSAGLSILAAPGLHTDVQVEKGATRKLLSTAVRSFDEVVVDAGSHWNWVDSALFEQAEKIYLVTQVGISELRNANRVITGGLSAYEKKLEVILNRHEPGYASIGDNVIHQALTKTAGWRIPSDYATIRDMQASAKPLVLSDSPIAQSIQAMAQVALGIEPQVPAKRNKFFGIFEALK